MGEAEGTIEAFIAAWRAGARSGTFEAVKFKADVTKSPVPRFDLLRFKHYLQVGIQFSRGCPFTCEFCDIIELYGRVPERKRLSRSSPNSIVFMRWATADTSISSMTI